MSDNQSGAVACRLLGSHEYGDMWHCRRCGHDLTTAWQKQLEMMKILRAEVYNAGQQWAHWDGEKWVEP